MDAQLGEIDQNSFRVYCTERRKADTEDMIEKMRWDNYRWYCSSMRDAVRDPTVPVVHIPLYVMLELEQTTGWGDAMCIAFGDYLDDYVPSLRVVQSVIEIGGKFPAFTYEQY